MLNKNTGLNFKKLKVKINKEREDIYMCKGLHEFIEMVKALDKAHPFYEYVSLICDGLSAFTNLSPTLIPENSLIREFIGS